MLGPAILLAALAVQPPLARPAQEAERIETAEIVVTGTRDGKCRMRLADRALSERQFEMHAGQWARLGRAIRVVHPSNTHYRCLARIAFRLSDKGVRLVHFVERAEGR